MVTGQPESGSGPPSLGEPQITTPRVAGRSPDQVASAVVAVLCRLLFGFLRLFVPADPPNLVRPTHVGPPGNRVRYIGPPLERAEMERLVQPSLLGAVPGLAR